MISVSPHTRTPAYRRPVAQPRLDWSEVVLRCRDEIFEAVEEVMASMEHQPFSVTDGIAVHQATTEALENLFQQFGTESHEPVRLRFAVSPEGVWLELEAQRPAAATEPAAPQALPEPAKSSGRTSLARSLMTSVEYRDQGRQVLLTRGRGQGSAVTGPPAGYDFQI